MIGPEQNYKLSPSIADMYRLEQKINVPLPLFSCGVSAGFPSPVDDYISQQLDLNDLLIRNPVATFFVRAAGDSMTGVGINDNDILVVDRSLKPVHGKALPPWHGGHSRQPCCDCRKRFLQCLGCSNRN